MLIQKRKSERKGHRHLSAIPAFALLPSDPCSRWRRGGGEPYPLLSASLFCSCHLRKELTVRPSAGVPQKGGSQEWEVEGWDRRPDGGLWSHTAPSPQTASRPSMWSWGRHWSCHVPHHPPCMETNSCPGFAAQQQAPPLL